MLLSLVNDKAVEWSKTRVAPPNDVAYEADRKRLREAARIFLRDQAGRTDVEPVAFELSFGMGERAGTNHPAPVAIPLGPDRTIQLRGQIDRIDRTPQGYELWDYKSGSDSPYSAGDLLDGGRKLQWLLYAYALQQLIDRDSTLTEAPVARSGYFFVSEKTQGRRIADPPLPPEALAHELQPLFEMLAAGGFPKIHKNGSAPCHFCEYQHVCADESTGKTEAIARLETTAEEDAPFASHALDWMK
jgi:ATP-dependent helicase/DNAse subunit B